MTLMALIYGIFVLKKLFVIKKDTQNVHKGHD